MMNEVEVIDDSSPSRVEEDVVARLNEITSGTSNHIETLLAIEAFIKLSRPSMINVRQELARSHRLIVWHDLRRRERESRLIDLLTSVIESTSHG